MTHQTRAVCKVHMPDGRPVFYNDLPRNDKARWTPLRRAQVVAAVRGGMITAEEAFFRYNLSEEEFYYWQRAVDRAEAKKRREDRG